MRAMLSFALDYCTIIHGQIAIPLVLPFTACSPCYSDNCFVSLTLVKQVTNRVTLVVGLIHRSKGNASDHNLTVPPGRRRRRAIPAVVKLLLPKKNLCSHCIICHLPLFCQVSQQPISLIESLLRCFASHNSHLAAPLTKLTCNRTHQEFGS